MRTSYPLNVDLERLSRLPEDDPRRQAILSHFGVNSLAPIAEVYTSGDAEERNEIETAIAFYLSKDAR
jgi:hypothetical protein